MEFEGLASTDPPQRPGNSSLPHGLKRERGCRQSSALADETPAAGGESLRDTLLQLAGRPDRKWEGWVIET